MKTKCSIDANYSIVATHPFNPFKTMETILYNLKTSIMKQTAMQELREDLQLSIDTAKNALLNIEDKDIRLACQEVVRLTLKTIIKRIDDELLEMEKQQIIDSYWEGCSNWDSEKDAEQYYNDKFNK